MMASYRKECFDLREDVQKLKSTNLQTREMVDELREYLQDREKMEDFCDWLLRRKGLGDIADRVKEHDSPATPVPLAAGTGNEGEEK